MVMLRRSTGIIICSECYTFRAYGPLRGIGVDLRTVAMFDKNSPETVLQT